MRFEGDGGLANFKGAEIGLTVRPGDLKVNPLLIGDFLIIYIGLLSSGHSIGHGFIFLLSLRRSAFGGLGFLGNCFEDVSSNVVNEVFF